MLQAFVQNVSSVFRLCCKRFYLDVAYVFTHMLQQYVPKYFICFSLLLQQVFSCCKLQVFNLDSAYVFTHMLQVYIPDVSSVLHVCSIQVFYVARVSCCSESQGRQGMGCGEPVACGRGVRRAGGRRLGARQGGGAPARAGRTDGDGMVQALGRACQACERVSDGIHPHRTSVR